MKRKVHLFDYEHDSKIPNWVRENENFNGAKGTKCGYVRKNTTIDKSKVTCKLCLKEVANEH